MKRPPTKRYPPGLSDDDRADFLERQQEFDDQLRASGFVDLEDGSDMADYPGASTLPGGADHDPVFDREENQPGPVKHLIKLGRPCKTIIAQKTRKGRRRKPHRSLEAFGETLSEHQTEFGAEPGQQLGFGSAPDYEFWRRVGHAVHDLPDGSDEPAHPHYAFLIDLSDSGNLAAAARRAGITRKVARCAFRKLLVAIGLGKSSYARSL